MDAGVRSWMTKKGLEAIDWTETTVDKSPVVFFMIDQCSGSGMRRVDTCGQKMEDTPSELHVTFGLEAIDWTGIRN